MRLAGLLAAPHVHSDLRPRSATVVEPVFLFQTPVMLDQGLCTSL